MRKCIATVLALLVLGAGPASAAEGNGKAPAGVGEEAGAQASARVDGDRPWAAGVSEAAQQKALELFKQGNALLKDSVFVQAAARYREALTQWDHPAIHYNLVLALLNLDQPVQVHRHLEQAMRFGPAPIDLDKFEQARAYKILVEKQLARVDIACAVEGAQVQMDGRPLFTGPGRYEGLVRPGPHSIIATKEGYLTNEISQALPAGELTRLDIDLFSTSDLTRYRRRWTAWKPWAVIGTGVVLGLAGGALQYGALDSFERFDTEILACDRATGGQCTAENYAGFDDVMALRENGRLMQGGAIAGYAIGGAALVTGVVLVYMNRPEAYTIEGPGQEAPAAPAITVAPMLGGDARGVVAAFRF